MENLKLNLREVGAISLNVNTADFQKIERLSKNRIKCFIGNFDVKDLFNHTNCYNVQLVRREDCTKKICLYFSIVEEELTEKEKELSLAEVKAFNERIEIFVEDLKEKEEEFNCFWGDVPDECLKQLAGRTIIAQKAWSRKMQKL